MSEWHLGRLERLDAREVWKSEAYDFTPWLRQNIGLLGEALGLEIAVDVQQEVAVGLFSADLLGTDLGSKANILIENQLEQTDHSHLGQLLTYAGGLDTDVLVWVSTKVREEHKQALSWLNEKSHEDVLFFGVEIELLRIGDSRPAPHFKVVVAPNEWQKSQGAKTTGAATRSSERNERYREFWGEVIAALRERDPTFTTASPERAPHQNWCGFSAGRTGFQNNISFGWEDGESILRSEIYIDTGDSDQNKTAFDELERQRSEIESEIGESLIWTRRDDIRASRIYAKRRGSLDDESALHECRDWFADHALRLKHVFGPRVRALDLASRAVAEVPVASPGDHLSPLG